MAITFRKLDEAVAADRKLSGPVLRLYILMLHLADFKTRQVSIYIRRLAKEYERSIRTVQKWLAVMIKEGLIERIPQKHKDNPRWNEKSLFIVHGNDAVRYVNTIYAKPEGEIAGQKDSWGGESQSRYLVNPRVTQKNHKTLESRENLKDTLKREALLPQNLSNTDQIQEPETTPATPAMSATSSVPITASVPEPPKTSNQAKDYDLTGVPDIMRHAVLHFLRETGRQALNPNEHEPIHVLSQNHTPERVMKEIDTAVERFQRQGRPLSRLYFGYIAACLRKQKSYDPEAPKKKRARRNKQGENSAPMSIPEQDNAPEVTSEIMPVSEAEKVIAEYAPAMKTCEGIPAVLEELHEKIRARDEESAPQMTLEEYLRLKFPEADEEELRTDAVPYHNQDGLYEAMQIDRTCANCHNPDTCPLNRKKGRPVVMLKPDIRGRKELRVGYTCTAIRCKHEKAKPDPEFEGRVKRSGLKEKQSQQTFTAYEHEGMPPEIVSAKAKAILAAKNHSNLILAGKAGTGKTHLAISIALSVMQEGRNAIFRTMPDLLDELRRADWEHADFNGLRRMFSDVSCLVIDDWGKEKATPKNMEYLYQIIDYRYRHGLQTIVTTNALDMFGLMNQWNADKIEPLVSRLLENGEWVTIREAENHRLKKRVATEESLPAPMTESEPEPQPNPQPEQPAVQPSESKAEWREDMYDRPESAKRRTPKHDEDDYWPDDDDIRSAGIIWKKDLTKTGLSRYCANYDSLSMSDKQQVIQWYLQNQDRLEAEEAAQSAPVEPKHEEVPDPEYYDDDLWKENEDEYRLYGDTGINPDGEDGDDDDGEIPAGME